MSTRTVEFGVALEATTCGLCGGAFAISAEVVRIAREKGKHGYYCPYCRAEWGWNGLGEADRLKRELEQEKNRLATERAQHDQTRAALEAKERQRAAAVGQTTKIKNRVKAGVCPFCRRNFPALGAHIRDQHPDEDSK